MLFFRCLHYLLNTSFCLYIRNACKSILFHQSLSKFGWICNLGTLMASFLYSCHFVAILSICSGVTTNTFVVPPPECDSENMAFINPLFSNSKLQSKERPFVKSSEVFINFFSILPGIVLFMEYEESLSGLSFGID